MSVISIIGAGSVGSTIAYTLVTSKVCSKLLLVDVVTERAQAEVEDLTDASFVTDTVVEAGSFKKAGQSDIIVITAGAKQKEGETRLDLVGRNTGILNGVFNDMGPLNPKAVVIIVANPCDILTYIAQEISGLPRKQVFGSGTFLDTQRLRAYLSSTLNITESSIHAYVMGEHGDSQFTAWSAGTIGNCHIDSILPKDFNKQQCEDYVKNKAYKIIKNKGATYYGISACVKSLCSSVLFDSRHVCMISHYIPHLNVCVSLPCVLGKNGVELTLTPHLNEKENASLLGSASAMRNTLDSYRTKHDI
ncbi:hypothetical protein HDU92_005635 [Lobulomyces angularis]|nr:hypothetical protein HDU92_005635 [Lobulomyces angularis]